MSRIRINNVRIGYPALFTPKAFKNEDGTLGKAKYSAVFYLDKKKNAEDIKKIQMEMNAQHAASAIPKHKFPPERLCLREVPVDKVDDDGKIDGTDIVAANTMILTASNNDKPVVVNKNREQRISEADDIIYAGCHVNVSVSFWVQNHQQYGKRINSSLEGVQFFKDSDSRFGRAPVKPEDEFEDIEEEDDPRA